MLCCSLRGDRSNGIITGDRSNGIITGLLRQEISGIGVHWFSSRLKILVIIEVKVKLFQP